MLLGLLMVAIGVVCGWSTGWHCGRRRGLREASVAILRSRLN
jgi:hypothetical protein